ncbi:MAG: 30S ribosomal protein S20 [candidate division NC10 bacterium]|jgi:small subunit ribosomal protein S20|nr:30S ribosomal protein S20 [candidate division NC10 bacterium]
MPIITSSIKDLGRTERRTQHNRAAKGKLRSSLKRVRVAVAGNQAEAAAQALAEATPVVDRAVTKGILHKNAAARHKSRLMRQLNRLGKPAAS